MTRAPIMLRSAALLALASIAATAQTSPQVTEFTVAGIRVIHKRVTANDVVAARLFLKGGAGALTRDKAGIENVLAQSATHGTQKYSKDAFTELATSTGTNVTGGVNVDFTWFGMQAVRQHLNDAWDLFTQAVVHPTFPDAEVQQVKEQIINDLKQRTDDPDSYLNLIADSLLYAGHPYAADVQGSEATVSRLTRADLASWHQRRLTKANLLLVVVGNVTQAELSPKIAASFGSLPSSGGASPTPPALVSTKSTVSVIERSLPTNYIIGLFPAPGRASPDYAAVQLATRVLSERLFEEVRTKRNLTYAVGAGISGALRSKGNLYVTAVEPDTTVAVIFSEVRRLQRQPVPRDLLQQTINTLITSYWMGQETNMGQATSLGQWELTGGGWRNARAYVDKMRMVTPADIQRAAAQVYKNARFVVIGDPKKINQSRFTSF
jgi:zinc protease